MGQLAVEEQIIFLYCSSLVKTGAFYEGVLGFELVVDQGSCRIVRVARGGGGYLGYCQREEVWKDPIGVILTFVVSSRSEVDAWYGHLLERGVQIPDPPRINPAFDIYHFFFQDPDGYKLEIQSFGNENWKTAARDV